MKRFFRNSLLMLLILFALPVTAYAFPVSYHVQVSGSFWDLFVILFGQYATLAILFCIIVAILMAIISMIFIYCNAPKHGMSYLWVLLPLVLNVVAVGIYMIFRFENSKSVPPFQKRCPHCGTPQTTKSYYCPNCGTKQSL